MNNLVSIVITTYNHLPFIRGAIKSVLEQSYKDIEIIIVDDGSTDETQDVVRKYIDNDRVRYVYQENAGLSAARNKGLECVRGDYIKFLDSDDWLYPLQIEKQMEDLKTADDPKAMSMTNFCMMGPSGAIQDIDVPMVEPARQFEHFYVSNRGGIHAFIFPTELVRQTGGFDENLRSCEDFDLKLRMIRKGAYVRKIGYNGCCYRLTEQSMSNDTLFMFREKCKVYEKLNGELLNENIDRVKRVAEPLKYKNLILISECQARKLSLEEVLPRTALMTEKLYALSESKVVKLVHKSLGFKGYLLMRYLYKTYKDKGYKQYLLNQEISWKIR